MTAALHVSDLRGGYSEVDILCGVNVSLAAGQIVTVAGTNGAGKSTLAKALAGLLPRVTGEIVVEGRSIAHQPAERRVALGIGYAPQVANIFAGLTILENLQVVAVGANRPARIEELLQRFPLLGERRRMKAGRLSGGERQQLAFARALVADPKILILDEPTAALSPSKVAVAFELIRSLPSFGVSVLIVEQRARQALRISDYGYIMDGGRVAIEGPAGTLLEDERAAELYLGRGAAGRARKPA